ncbi:MAG: orotidine-5'-phosphate decarboxylase, partial [Proteobacteria bacterium]|nr:orotidine-5'-phosphate decarboxylase [Pseudomonadota bacterium]
PLLAVVLAVSAAFPVFDQWMEALQHFVVRNFLPDTGRRMIGRQLTEFTENAAQLTAIGVLFLGVTSLSLILSVDETFNRLFRVAQRRRHAHRLLLYLAVLVLAPLLIGASVSMTTWFVGQSLGFFGGSRWVSAGALRFVPYAFTCAALTLLYLLLPNRKVRPVHALAGGLFAGLAFEVAKRGFALYISYFPTYTMIYGAFAAIPIFLLWIYISWLVVLLGATITAVMTDADPLLAGHPAAPVCGRIDAAGAPSEVRPEPTEPAKMSAPASPAHTVDRRDRLIVALDVASFDEARALVETLGDSVRFYKIGLELFTSGSYFELLDWLAARDKKVFADLKFYDIPETVRRAVANLRGRGVTFATVHGHRSIMEAAAGAKGDIRILAVTVLTSFDKSDLAEMGAAGEVQQLVLSRARGAAECGCDGVISSGLEAPQIKAAFGERLLVVTPGIRPVENRPADDQKRTVDVAQAFANGADYIVVGRPVRQAADPRLAAEAIQATIAGAFPAN